MIKQILEEKENLTEEEKMNRAADAFLFYRKHFKNFLAWKKYEWLSSLGIKDWTKDSREHAIWHQGALEVLEELKIWFEDQANLSASRFNKEEESEEGSGIPPIE